MSYDSNLIKRVFFDYTNTTANDQQAIFKFNTSTEILQPGLDYMLNVETCQTDLSGMALNNNPNYSIAFWYTRKDNQAPYGYTMETFSDPLQTLSQLDNWLYNFMHKKFLPLNLGSIGVSGDRMYMNIPSDVYSELYSGTDPCMIMVNANLAALMPEFVDMYSGPYSFQGVKLYKVNLVSTTGPVKHGTYTFDTIITARRVEFISENLAVTPTTVLSNTDPVETNYSILASTLINPETYSIDRKTNIIYVPTVYRDVTFNNAYAIKNFSIYVYIIYKDGSRVIHTLKPDDYMSMQLAFKPLGGLATLN